MKYESRDEMSPRPNSVPTYEWETEPDRAAFKRIMVDSFLRCYKDIPKEVLKVDADLREWLSNHFSDRFFDELKRDGNKTLLATAKIDRTPAGYAAFDLSQYPGQVYLSEMAVDPAYQRRGIGKGLVFSILQRFPQIEKIVLITRKSNSQSIAFYPSIGFQLSDYIREGYDPQLYIGFEFKVKSP